MPLSYYFDQHIPRAVARGLLRRQIDVLTTQDSDYIAIANRWLASGRSFPGLVQATDPRRDIGRASEDLQTIAACYSAEEMVNRIVHIPL